MCVAAPPGVSLSRILTDSWQHGESAEFGRGLSQAKWHEGQEWTQSHHRSENMPMESLGKGLLTSTNMCANFAFLPQATSSSAVSTSLPCSVPCPGAVQDFCWAPSFPQVWPWRKMSLQTWEEERNNAPFGCLGQVGLNPGGASPPCLVIRALLCEIREGVSSSSIWTHTLLCMISMPSSVC